MERRMDRAVALIQLGAGLVLAILIAACGGGGGGGNGGY
jgi:hypothetical protein